MVVPLIRRRTLGAPRDGGSTTISTWQSASIKVPHGPRWMTRPHHSRTRRTETCRALRVLFTRAARKIMSNKTVMVSGFAISI